MEKYSLAICKEDPSDCKVISWDDFMQTMRKRGAAESIIFATHEIANFRMLADRTLINQLIIAIEGVRHLDGYCLIDHSSNDRLMPCLVLLDPDMQYAADKARVFHNNNSVIHCRLDPDNGSMSVVERPLVTPDLLSGISKDIRAAGKVSPRNVAELFGMEHLFDEKDDDGDER